MTRSIRAAGSKVVLQRSQIGPDSVSLTVREGIPIPTHQSHAEGLRFLKYLQHMTAQVHLATDGC
jgi:hypothetical protein